MLGERNKNPYFQINQKNSINKRIDWFLSKVTSNFLFIYHITEDIKATKCYSCRSAGIF